MLLRPSGASKRKKVSNSPSQASLKVLGRVVQDPHLQGLIPRGQRQVLWFKAVINGSRKGDDMRVQVRGAISAKARQRCQRKKIHHVHLSRHNKVAMFQAHACHKVQMEDRKLRKGREGR